MIPFLCVFAGGGIGAVLRYAISLIPFASLFPFSTFICNVLGAIAIGVFSEIVDRSQGSFNPDLVKFIQTGIFGGFTTFSTFSLETFNLLDGGQIVLGTVYAAASLVCCIVGVLVGRSLVRMMVPA